MNGCQLEDSVVPLHLHTSWMQFSVAGGAHPSDHQHGNVVGTDGHIPHDGPVVWSGLRHAAATADIFLNK